jgi:hypothetical protein
MKNWPGPEIQNAAASSLIASQGSLQHEPPPGQPTFRECVVSVPTHRNKIEFALHYSRLEARSVLKRAPAPVDGETEPALPAGVVSQDR